MSGHHVSALRSGTTALAVMASGAMYVHRSWVSSKMVTDEDVKVKRTDPATARDVMSSVSGVVNRKNCVPLIS